MAPITLAQAAQNAAEDYDAAVIDEFRTSLLMERLTFVDAVNPVGGGATLTYGYRRLVTPSTAARRTVNNEFPESQAETVHKVIGLGVFGQKYRIDRVVAKIGAAASGEITLQSTQAIKATRALFSDMVVNGTPATTKFDQDAPNDTPNNRDTTAVTPSGFNGLSAELAGSSTDTRATEMNWQVVTQAEAWTILAQLDEFLSLLDERPDAIMANKKVLLRLKDIARRAGYYTRTEDAFGTTIDLYDGIELMDVGEKSGRNDPIIPIVAGATDIYALRFAEDGFHGVTTMGSNLVESWLPDYTREGAGKLGEVELGPVGVALKKTKAAAVGKVRLGPAALAGASAPDPADLDDGGAGAGGDRGQTDQNLLGGAGGAADDVYPDDQTVVDEATPVEQPAEEQPKRRAPRKP
jgi:hypothetical protein